MSGRGDRALAAPLLLEDSECSRSRDASAVVFTDEQIAPFVAPAGARRGAPRVSRSSASSAVLSGSPRGIPPLDDPGFGAGALSECRARRFGGAVVGRNRPPPSVTLVPVSPTSDYKTGFPRSTRSPTAHARTPLGLLDRSRCRSGSLCGHGLPDSRGARAYAALLYRVKACTLGVPVLAPTCRSASQTTISAVGEGREGAGVGCCRPLHPTRPWRPTPEAKASALSQSGAILAPIAAAVTVFRTLGSCAHMNPTQHRDPSAVAFVRQRAACRPLPLTEVPHVEPPAVRARAYAACWRRGDIACLGAGQEVLLRGNPYA
jgi:hypothetical protein